MLIKQKNWPFQIKKIAKFQPCQSHFLKFRDFGPRFQGVEKGTLPSGTSPYPFLPKLPPGYITNTILTKNYFKRFFQQNNALKVETFFFAKVFLQIFLLQIRFPDTWIMGLTNDVYKNVIVLLDTSGKIFCTWQVWNIYTMTRALVKRWQI